MGISCIEEGGDMSVSGPNVNLENLQNLQKDVSTLNKIASRVHYITTQMIFQANHRDSKEKGDPKIGGHPAASASTLHILAALHLLIKNACDHIANKPHSAPTDHAYNYLLDMLFKRNSGDSGDLGDSGDSGDSGDLENVGDFEPLSEEEARKAMLQLRAFPTEVKSLCFSVLSFSLRSGLLSICSVWNGWNSSCCHRLFGFSSSLCSTARLWSKCQS